MCVCMYVCVCIYECMYVCMYVCMCVYVCMYVSKVVTAGMAVKAERLTVFKNVPYGMVSKSLWQLKPSS